MPRQIIIKLLKTKGKEKILKAIRKKKKKKAHYLQGENNQKDKGCIIRKRGGQEKVALLKITDRKELSTVDSISGKKKKKKKPFRNEGEIKTLSNEEKLKKNVNNKPIL